MTPDQVRSLLAAAQNSRDAPLFALLVNSGLRRGEALALHWSDIDFDASCYGYAALWPEWTASSS